jgi:predicted ATP-binding protein involved in virulence
MKIIKITLQNYKRFVQAKTFSFVDSDEIVNEKTLLVGNNGT